ncbi:MAG: hypothetical protein JWP74_2342 [Marmoricola sp.]|nr:hypothetical protein [Marmoricola sp.]
MTRRTAASLLALVLGLGLLIAAAFIPVPYVVINPGPTYNVLGSDQGKPFLHITGHKTYPDTGQLRMVTVYVTSPEVKVHLRGALSAWVNKDATLIPRDVEYPKATTNKANDQQSAQQMSTSQDDATAAALGVLGIKYQNVVEVAAVQKGGASDGRLRTGDFLLSVAGHQVNGPDDLIKLIRDVAPGTSLRLGIERANVKKSVVVVTRPAPDDPKASRVNIAIGTNFRFPFPVDIRLPGNIGGPSAGMMFALSIYDVLTPGSLTGGHVIAGTGEISPNGTVSPIGGIGEKLVSAQRDGAKLFLVASENCAEAAKAHYDPSKMRLVRVHTLGDAIKAVNTWRDDPTAALPTCS